MKRNKYYFVILCLFIWKCSLSNEPSYLLKLNREECRYYINLFSYVNKEILISKIDSAIESISNNKSDSTSYSFIPDKLFSPYLQSDSKNFSGFLNAKSENDMKTLLLINYKLKKDKKLNAIDSSEILYYLLLKNAQNTESNLVWNFEPCSIILPDKIDSLKHSFYNIKDSLTENVVDLIINHRYSDIFFINDAFSKYSFFSNQEYIYIIFRKTI